MIMFKQQLRFVNQLKNGSYSSRIFCTATQRHLLSPCPIYTHRLNDNINNYNSNMFSNMSSSYTTTTRGSLIKSKKKKSIKKKKSLTTSSASKKKKDNVFYEGEQRWVFFNYEPSLSENDVKDIDDIEHEEEDQESKSKKKNNNNNNKKKQQQQQLQSKTIRIDKLISDNLKLSREYVTFLLDKGLCRIIPAIVIASSSNATENNNNSTSNEPVTMDTKYVVKKYTTRNLRKGDRVYVFLQQRHEENQIAQQNELNGEQHDQESIPPAVTITKDDVIYDDEHVIVVNKPQGYAVHASGGHPPHTTMLYAIRKYVEETKKKKAPKLPLFVSLVHRLDKDTSGVLISGKNSYSVQHLNRQFLEKTMSNETEKKYITKKIYCAICAVPRVDKFKELLSPTSADFGLDGQKQEKDPFLMDDSFDFNDFIVELPSGEKRNLTQQDIDDYEKMKEVDEEEEEDVEEDDAYEQEEEEIELETEEDLERAIAKEEAAFEQEIDKIIARGEEQNKQAEQIERNQIIIVNKPITVLHKSHRFQGDNRMYSVRYSIENEGVEPGTGEELLLQKQMKKSKSAKSVIRVVEVNQEKQLALVMVSIKSGRTHQIRSHLTSIGAPVLGDNAYYDLLDNRIVFAVDRRVKPKRTMLHCMQMRFLHPFETKSVQCFAPVQGEMLTMIQKYFSEEAIQEVTGRRNQS